MPNRSLQKTASITATAIMAALATIIFMFFRRSRWCREWNT